VLDRVAVVLDSSLSFAAEHFDDVITEAEPLLDEHWREIAFTRTCAEAELSLLSQDGQLAR